MRMRSLASLVVPSLLVFSIATLARGAEPLTLEGALAIARDRAPAIVAERLRLEEARARAAKDSRPFASDPVLAGSIGRRESGDSAERWDDWEVAISQDLGGVVRGPARDGAASAALEAELRASDEASRAVLLDVANAFVEELALERRHMLASDSMRAAETLHEAAVRRFEAGDVAQIDVNLAFVLLGRASAELTSINAESNRTSARLASLLGLEGRASFVIVDNALTLPEPPPRGDLEAAAVSRPDILRLDAEIAATRAALALASPLRALDWSLVASVGREEGDDVATAGVSVGLPFVDGGRFARAEASARLARLEHERSALARAAVAELDAAWVSNMVLYDSASTLTGSVLPSLEESDVLAAESYEAGQIGIAELAAIRRESIETRNVIIDHWLEARKAALRLQFLTGDLR